MISIFISQMSFRKRTLRSFESPAWCHLEIFLVRVWKKRLTRHVLCSSNRSLAFMGVCEGWKALCSTLAAENQATGNDQFKLPVQAWRPSRPQVCASNSGLQQSSQPETGSPVWRHWDSGRWRGGRISRKRYLLPGSRLEPQRSEILQRDKN